MNIRLLIFPFLLLSAARGQELSPQDAIRRMKVADGFEVRLVASEPDVRQPLTITFDDKGRLWVLQYLQYPNPAGLTPVKVDEYLRTVYDRLPEPPPKGPKGADRITILEDKDGDGRYESAKDFIGGLNLATGMCLGHGGLFVVQPPYLLFYPDRNRDDVPDSDPDVLLTGFGQEDSHAYANSLQWGPDGWLYGAHGSTVTAKIRGIEFQQGIWRYHPLTQDFELFAEGGGNTWGLDFDRHGNVIAGTNWGGYAMLHQVQGAYYLKGFGKHGPLHNPHTYGYFDHVPYPKFKGGHVTCGGIVYQGGAFPAQFENMYLASNPLSNDLYWHVIEPRGSSFANRFGGDLLVSGDPWFRAVDCLAGPDGALYVADWHDKRLNHVDPRDNWDKSNGRIYRIAPKDLAGIRPAGLEKMTGAELVDLLGHRNDWFRREARRIVAERRDPSIVPLLKKRLAEAKDAQVLWALYVGGGFDEDLALELLKHPAEDVRAWAIRFQGDTKKISPEFRDALVALAKTEPSPRVRNQMACTAKRLPAADALPVARELLRRAEDVDDPQIPLLLWWVLENKATAHREDVLRLFDSAEGWDAPITRKHIVERIGRRYLAEGGAADHDACARLLASAPGPQQVTLLIQGMEKALEGRKLDAIPAALQAPIAELLKSQPSNLTLLSFAIRLGNADAYARALDRLADPSLAEAEGLALIPLMGQVGRPDCIAPLLKILAASPSTGLKGAAIGALGPFQDPAIPPAVMAAYPKLPAPLRTRAQAMLAARPATAFVLLQAVEETTIAPKDIPLEQLQRIAAHADPALTKLLEKHWGRIGAATAGEKRAQMRSIQTMLSRGKGDRLRGKAHVQKLCLPCHTLFGEGNKIGPELDGADRKNLEVLLSNIVDPTAILRPEYQAHQLLTTDGQVLTGLIADQTPEALTLLDAQNVRTVIAKQRVQAMKPSAVSLMPEKILDPLDDQQICDFFAYLRGDALVQDLKRTLNVCLVSGSLEYESDASLAALQDLLEKDFNVRCTRAFRKSDEEVPGLENLETADVMVVFTRRLKISGEPLERVKKFCDSGKPIVGIRTASHAFQNWLAFDKEILGGNYSNHYGKGPECTVEFAPKGGGHPILEGIKPFASKSSLYRNPEIAADAEVLLTGTAAGKKEPVAWTRAHKGGRVFYTSLGDQGDFKNEQFVRMIVNAIHWTARRQPDKREVKAWPAQDALPGTAPLDKKGDLAAEMVAGIDRFLLREIEASVEKRALLWKRDPSSREAYEKSVAPNRERFRKIIGVVDDRMPFLKPEIITRDPDRAVVGSGERFTAVWIRWPLFRGVQAEGLLLRPGSVDQPVKPRAYAVALPDADQPPEVAAGLEAGVAPELQFARQLAENGVLVAVPLLINRSSQWSTSLVGRGTNQPHREFLYRPAFEMGRHVIGYEVQKALALVDWFAAERGAGAEPIGVFGQGEGGLLALYAGAADPRIDLTWVSGYFESRQNAWQEPIYRNVNGLLREFGDAELASLIAPRAFVAHAGPPIAIDGPPKPKPGGGGGAAPGQWSTPGEEDTVRELARFKALVGALPMKDVPDALDLSRMAKPSGSPKQIQKEPKPDWRMKKALDNLLDDTQFLLRWSEKVRNAPWAKIDKKTLEGYEKATEPIRDRFYGEVIGKFDLGVLPPNPRSRLIYDEPKYRGYEVMLDVFPDVYAYGILLLPKDLKDGERRPVVVCQHGLEGRPQDVADPKKNVPAYDQYACKLAERGFVVFAPQNPYIGRDAFRTLQRKANLIGTQLFSIIIPQHQVITDWLAAQPYVDPERIAFYGLSYGGKTAMRVPAVVKRYCLSICSADFNEWIWKNASLDNGYTYVTTGEYEIFEWNLGHTFNYAEMAALIAPRPFMVERGHYDGVAPDEQVAYEYAKVRRHYTELKIPHRTEIEFFNGPHKINGVGTFDFLHRHLKWPKSP